MSLHEIVLAETKPETEWVRGRPGTALVIVIDPRAQTLAAYDGATRFFRRGERFEHPVLPGFSLDLAAVFARIAQP